MPKKSPQKSKKKHAFSPNTRRTPTPKGEPSDTRKNPTSTPIPEGKSSTKTIRSKSSPTLGKPLQRTKTPDTIANTTPTQTPKPQSPHHQQPKTLSTTEKKLRSRHIFLSDIWSILRQPASLLTLLALCIMPAFYAWFNIIASWDPYGNTRNIRVAVASLDEGTETFGEAVNIGNETIAKLRTNDSMGWQFVDATGAVEGVRRGEYYASIVIPKDFSHDMMSFLTDTPKKPKLLYTVNEKINAIVPKITQKGVESIESQIESAFISSLGEQFFDKSNTAGARLQSHRDDITKTRSLIADIAPKMNEIHASLQKGERLSASGIDAINKTIFYLPDLSKSLGNIVNMTDSAKSLDATVGDALDRVPQIISAQMALANLLMSDAIHLLDTTHDLTASASGVLLPTLQNARTKLERADRVVVSLGRILGTLDGMTRTGLFTPMVEANQTLHQKLTAYISLLKKTENALIRGEAITGNMLANLRNLSNEVNRAYMNLQNLVASQLRPSLDTLRANLVSLLDTAGKDAKILQNDIPRIKEFLESVRSMLSDGNAKISDILSHWGDIENGVKKMQTLSNTLSDDRIDSLLRLLLLDPENEKNFFTHPIELNSTHLFPIANYGSAIAPFFTILALWVGALLSVSLLSVRSSLALEHASPRRGYIGRMVLFLIIGVVQALVVSLGNPYLLHTSVASVPTLVVVCILSALLFQAIVYSMVYLLGNVGKALAILLLLLQLSASGGTFPVELTNSFFIEMHPYLPFTYAIGGAREAVGGVVREVLAYHMSVLFAMLAGVLVLGVLLAPYLSRFAIAFEKRTEGMDIFH